MASRRGLRRLSFSPDEEFRAAAEDPAAFDDLAEELRRYFAGELRAFRTRLDLCGSPFQLRVWKALRDVPWGQVRSYAEIARAIGSPGAARAVGGANGRNPVAILVPCHRIVAADGGIGGYSAGLGRKRRLLKLERAAV